MSDLQRLYGLTVQSDMPLHQDRPAPPGSTIDVSIRTGEWVEADSDLPAGDELLSFAEGGRRFYSAVRLPDGATILRFDGACEFRMTPSLSGVTVHSVRGADPGLPTVLTTGALLAFQLYMRSHAVLHASSVDVGGRALAFVGHSGMGKSTMAAIMCAAGARIVTDDVLRLDFERDCGRHDLVLTRLGATEVRLRKSADSLHEKFHGSAPDRRVSADERQVLRLRGDAHDALPLAGILIPRPDRDRVRANVRRIAGKRALFALLNFPRLMGWQDPTVLDRQLAHLGRLVATVPVFVADVPWGPPFSSSIAADVISAVDAEGQSTSAESSGIR